MIYSPWIHGVFDSNWGIHVQFWGFEVDVSLDVVNSVSLVTTLTEPSFVCDVLDVSSNVDTDVFVCGNTDENSISDGVSMSLDALGVCKVLPVLSTHNVDTDVSVCVGNDVDSV